MRHLLLTLLMLVASVATMSAYDFEVNGIYYIKNGNKATVTNKNSYNTYSGDVSIPATVTYGGVTYRVTAIGASAFRECTGLTSIVIPGSITAIGNYAFYGCTDLATIMCWPDNPPVIQANTFSDETNWNAEVYVLESSIEAYRDASIWNYFYFVMPMDSRFEVDGIYYEYLSYGNVNVTYKGESFNSDKTYSGNVVIPEHVMFNGDECTVVGIGHDAFYYCDSLTGVSIPNTVTTIGRSAFSRCEALTDIVFGDGITTIEANAFHGCERINTLTLPNSVRSIGNQAFSACKGITELNLSSSLESIGEDAFWACIRLKDLEIPNTVTSMGASAFSSCNVLRTLKLSEGLTVIPQMAFGGCYKLDDLVIPNTVKTIEKDAFSYCNALTTLTIGESVETIGDGAFRYGRLIKRVICRAVNPPAIAASTAFYCISGDTFFTCEPATLFVPLESLAAYQAHEEWSKFLHIVPYIGAGPGDVNGDGDISISDVTELITQLLSGGEVPTFCDVSGDGRVSITDITVLIDMLLKGGI